MVKRLVARAHAAGVLRPEAVEQDLAVIPVLIGGVISSSRSIDPELWRCYLAGIRAGEQDPLPGSAPTGRHVTRMIEI